MADLTRILADLFPSAEAKLEEVDLYEIASILEPFYPDCILCSLALLVAYAAVKRGGNSLVWEPKVKTCGNPKCTCCLVVGPKKGRQR